MSGAQLVPLDEAECVALLTADSVGRVAFLHGDYPVVLPVNYRCVDVGHRLLIALRTRPGNIVDLAPRHVAFEVDGIDRYHGRGWSVLVQGTLRHLDSIDPAVAARFDSLPWITAERDAWLVIEPQAISGRRLEAATLEWAFHASAYL